MPDSHSVLIRLTVPGSERGPDQPVTFAGVAALTRALTSFGGPRRLAGAVHLYELRLVAGTASKVIS